MRLCKHCKHPLPQDSNPKRVFCSKACGTAHSKGEYAPNPIPLSKRYPDPVWGGLADLWRNR